MVDAGLIEQGGGVEFRPRRVVGTVVPAVAVVSSIAAVVLEVALAVAGVGDEVDSPVRAALAGDAGVAVAHIALSPIVVAAGVASSSRLIVKVLVGVFLRI